MRYLSLILAFAFCGTLCFAQKQEIHSDPTELIPSTGGGVQFVYTLPVNLEFEDGPLDLTALGTGNTWCWDSSAAANWGWGHFTTNANGAVQGAQDSYLLLPFTVVGTAASVPVISFQLKYNISSSDKVWLEVSDNFATWEVLGTRAVDSGSTGENWYDAAQPYWTGTVADYVRVSFPIVDYQTRPNLFFRLRFESSGQAAGQGVWMDDLRIQEGPLPASSLSVPFSEDFETGAPDWTNASTLWEVGAPTSTRNLFDQTVEGNQALVTELSGTYSQLGDLEVDYFYSPRFNLTDLNEDPVLSFFQGRNMAFEEDDFSVEYTLDAGRTWARLGAFGDSINGPYRHNWYNAQNPDRWNGVLANYEESQHELTGAAGQGKVQFRFRFLSTRQEIAIADGVLIDALTLELPAAQDLKVLEMLPIEFEFDELDTVRVQVLNLGADSATNWTVSLFYDKDSLLSQVSPPALAAGDTADVTLTGFSFSAPDENHLLTAVVSAPGDTRALNDSLTRPIYVRSKATLPLFEEFNGAVQGLTSSAPFQEPGWHLEVAPGGSGTALWASNFSGSSPYSPPTALWFFGNNGTETSVILTADASAYTTADSLYLSFFYRYPADIQNSDEKVWVRGSVYSAWLPLYSWPAESRFDNFGFTGYLDVGQALQAGGQQFTNTFQVRITSNGNAGSSSSPIMIDQFRISDTLPPASVNILSWEDVGRTDFTQAIDTVQGVLTNQGGQTFGDLSVHLYINESPIDSQSLGIFAPFDTVTLTYSNLGLSAPGEYDFRLVALNGEDTVLNSVQYDVITTPLSLPVVQNFEDHQTILEPNQQIPEEPGWVFTGESGSHLELLQNGYGIPGVVGEGAAFLSNKENTIASLIAYVDASALSVSQDHLFLSFYYNLLFFHDTLNTVSVRGSGNDDWISLNVWDFDSPRDTTLYSGLIDLAPVLQSIGQAFSSTTQIRFTHSGFGLLPEQGIMLDGIRLDTQKVTRDLQVAQIRVPDLSLGGGPDTVTVVVANAAELITDSVDVQVTVLDPSGGQLVNTVSTLNGPWGPGTNQELSFTNVDFSTAGQYIVTAVLLNAADQVPNNDSLTVTVTSPPTVVPSSPLAFTFDGCFSSEVVSTDGEVTGSLEGTPVREAGYAQQGITLAGSGSYINLGTASTAVYTESMTVALWLNPATLNQRRWVIGRNRDGQNSGWLLRLRDGKPELALPGTSGPGIFPAGDALVTNTWQHVAFTFSGDTVVAYINGVETSRYSGIGGQINANANAPITIGRTADGLGNNLAYQGSLDELWLSSSVLSASAIDSMANVALNPVACGVDTATLQAAWSFDDCGVDYLSNSVTPSIEGVRVNGLALDSGYNQQAVQFGGNGQAARLYDSTWNMGAGDAVSYSTWVYPTNPQGNFEAIVCRVTSGNSFLLALKNLQPAVLLGGLTPNQWSIANAILPLNQWSHLTVTYGAGVLTLYVNGTEAMRRTGFSGSLNFGNGYHQAGIRWDNQRAFSGKIDELRIFNTALTAEMASEEYTRLSADAAACPVIAAVPVAQYLFDSCDNSVAYDVYGNTGTIVGATKGVGYDQTGVQFDGNDYINLGQASALKISGDLSLSLWINSTQAVGTGVMLINNPDGSNFSYSLNLRNGIPELSLGSGVSGINVFPMGTPVADGQWHHLTYTFAGQQVIAYLDGNQVRVWYDVQGSPLTNATTEVWMGGRTGKPRFYVGSLDLVSVYNVALSPGQVTQLASLPQNSTDCSGERSLVPEIGFVDATQFSVYPNPTTGQVQITFGKVTTETATITVTNLVGQTVHQATLTPGQAEHAFTLGPNCEAGIYLIHVVTKEGFLTRRLVKE